MERLATIELEKEYLHFSAAHFTIFSARERERLHGHNFRVAAKITALVDENGLCFNYQVIKKRLKELCQALDEYTLLPSLSPYLSISELSSDYRVEFAGEVMHFLKKDVLLLPVRNISIEELADYFLQKIMEENVMSSIDARFFEVKVSTGPGLWGTAVWAKP